MAPVRPRPLTAGFLAILVASALLVARPARTAPVTASKLGESLAARIETLLRGRALRHARVGIAVAALPGGEVVYSRDAGRPLTPASTMKLLTTAAVLDRLGPEFRFATRFHATGPFEDGVLNGDLYVRGSGAPDLVIERWWDIALDFEDLGLTEIRGDVVGDASYFDDELRPPGWPGPSNWNPYNAPVSALSANFNTVRVFVLPTRKGHEPIVLLEPKSAHVRADNRARTGGRTSLKIRRAWNGKVNTISVRGTVGTRSGGRSEWIGVEDPPRFAAGVLRAILEEIDVTITGKTRVGTVPEDAKELWTYRSPPLPEIVADANKNSNNFMTECLLKTLGAESFGEPGTREKGVRAIREFLAMRKIHSGGIVLADGSGLSRANRLTARTLVELLVSMAADPVAGPHFVASLPAAGEEGTMRRRLGDARDRLVAKTGSIRSVRSLAGYVSDPARRPAFAFAVIVNGYRSSDKRVTEAMDGIVREIVREAGVAVYLPSTNGAAGS